LSSFRRGVDIGVELRDQFTEANGALPDDHPAEIVISVGRSLLNNMPGDGLHTVRELLRTAAISFDAVTGYVHGSGSASSMQSPFERRNPVRWRGQKLDSMSRGVHWGNLIGAGHLAAIGGLQRIEGLVASGRVSRLERWSKEPELWWYEITTDPFAPCNDHADTLAEQLAAIVPSR
jgi:hypothetical protein